MFWGKKKVKNGSKIGFRKNDPTPFGAPRHVKVAYLEAILSHFGLLES